MSSNDPGSSGYDPSSQHDPAAGQPGTPPGQPSTPPGYPQQEYVAAPVAVAVCQNCGTQLPPGAMACVSCQAPVMLVNAPSKDKVVAGLLALLVGSLGVHKFYLGYNTAGGIMLGLTVSGICLSVVLIGILWAWVPGMIALVEGIIYLTKSDYDFQMTYVVNKKEWF